MSEITADTGLWRRQTTVLFSPGGHPFTQSGSAHLDGGLRVGRRAPFKAWGTTSALKSLCGGHIVGKDLRRLPLKLCLQSKHRIFTLCMYLGQPGGQRPQKAVVQSLSCLTPCNPMDCSTPGFPVHHHLPESAQTHVH